MIELDVYNKSGEEVDSLEIDPEMLGGEINIPLLHQAVVAYQSRRRSGTANTKTRAEVNYSNAKPWPQKGTGRARHGERGSPLWIGGGITFGPRKRDFSKHITKSMKQRALDSALLSKLQDGEVVLVEEFEMTQPKTREAAEFLSNLDLEGTNLILISEYDRNKHLATRNLPDTVLKPVSETNAEELLKYKQVIFEQEALQNFLKDRVKKIHDVDLEDVETELDLDEEEE